MAALTLTTEHSLAHHIAQATPPTPDQQAAYQAAYQAAWAFPEQALLVLDTNVLLHYYQLPIASRKRLHAFLEQHQGRLYYSDQVRREYERHAQPLRQQHRRLLGDSRPTAEQAALRPALQAYLDRQAPLWRAYPQLQAQWQSVYANSGAWLKRLRRHAEQQSAALRRDFDAADLQPLLETWQPLPSFSKKEYQRLKHQVHALAQTVGEEPIKGFANATAAYAYRHPERTYPGLGDALTKTDQGLGDYVLYHELLKLALALPDPKPPILFLTNDHIKGDWMTPQERPYAHYYQHFDTQTGTLCHFLPAHAWLEQNAQVTLTPLLERSEVGRDAQHYLWQQPPNLTSESIPALLAELYPNRPKAQAPDWEQIKEDLAEERGITTVAHLRDQLLACYPRLIAREQQLDIIHDRLAALQLSLDIRP